MNWETIKTNILNFLWQLATTVGLRLLYAVLLIIVGSKLVSILVKRLRKAKLFSKMETSVSHFLINMINVTLRVLIFVSAALILGVPATSFVAILTSAGVAIGLALQGSLSNFAGGIMILLFKPFRTGDYIESGDVKGTVADITVFYTVLTTPDNKVIHCPNGALSNTEVINFSEKETRRLDIPASCAYGTDTDLVKRVLTEVAEAHPLVLKDPAPAAKLDKCNDSSLDFFLRVWCNNSDYWTVYYELTEQVKAALDSNHIDIPYPQMDVHIKQDEPTIQ